MPPAESPGNTYEVVDFSALLPIEDTPKALRYHCPNCESKRGKADTDAKLYYYKSSHSGWCFKCHTVFYPPTHEGIDTSQLEFKQALSQASAKLDYTPKHQHILKQVSFDFPPLHTPALVYLKQRNFLLLSLIKYLNIRAWMGTETGVVLPFYQRDTLFSFQTRFLHRTGSNKYYTCPGTKLFYCPNRQFTWTSTPELILCEGVFDAIALFIMGYDFPCAMLGSTLTEIQLSLLRSFLPEHIILALDEYALNRALVAKVKSLPSVSDVEVFTLPEHLDPEEYLVERLKEDHDYENLCRQRISHLLERHTSWP